MLGATGPGEPVPLSSTPFCLGLESPNPRVTGQVWEEKLPFPCPERAPLQLLQGGARSFVQLRECLLFPRKPPHNTVLLPGLALALEVFAGG